MGLPQEIQENLLLLGKARYICLAGRENKFGADSFLLCSATCPFIDIVRCAALSSAGDFLVGGFNLFVK